MIAVRLGRWIIFQSGEDAEAIFTVVGTDRGFPTISASVANTSTWQMGNEEVLPSLFGIAVSDSSQRPRGNEGDTVSTFIDGTFVAAEWAGCHFRSRFSTVVAGEN